MDHENSSGKLDVGASPGTSSPAAVPQTQHSHKAGQIRIGRHHFAGPCNPCAMRLEDAHNCSQRDWRAQLSQQFPTWALTFCVLRVSTDAAAAWRRASSALTDASTAARRVSGVADCSEVSSAVFSALAAPPCSEHACLRVNSVQHCMTLTKCVRRPRSNLTSRARRMISASGDFLESYRSDRQLTAAWACVSATAPSAFSTPLPSASASWSPASLMASPAVSAASARVSAASACGVSGPACGVLLGTQLRIHVKDRLDHEQAAVFIPLISTKLCVSMDGTLQQHWNWESSCAGGMATSLHGRARALHLSLRRRPSSSCHHPWPWQRSACLACNGVFGFKPRTDLTTCPPVLIAE